MIFVIHSDFKKCASLLHTKDLESQIKDMHKIIAYCTGDYDDLNLWKNHLKNLAMYWIYSIREWEKRDDRTKTFKKVIKKQLDELEEAACCKYTVPYFMEETHLYSKHLMISHRAFLLRKRPKFYKQKFPKLYKKLDEYPKGLFYMDTRGDKEKENLNKAWKKVIPVPQNFFVYENIDKGNKE